MGHVGGGVEARVEMEGLCAPAPCLRRYYDPVSLVRKGKYAKEEKKLKKKKSF